MSVLIDKLIKGMKMKYLRKRWSNVKRIVAFFSLLSSYAVDLNSGIYELVIRFKPFDRRIKLYKKKTKPKFRYLPMLDLLGFLLYPFVGLILGLWWVIYYIFVIIFYPFLYIMEEEPDWVVYLVLFFNVLVYIAGVIHIILYYI